MNVIEKQNVDNEKDSELYILKEKVKELMTNLALSWVWRNGVKAEQFEKWK